MTKDTKCESNKIKLDITNKSEEVSPFPSGDHKVAMKRIESMTNTRHQNTNYPQKKTKKMSGH